MAVADYSRPVYLVKLEDSWNICSDLLAIFYDKKLANKFAKDYLIWYFECETEAVYYSDEDDGYVFEGEDHISTVVEESRVHASDDVPNLAMFK